MNLDEYYISKPTIEAVGVFTILWCQFEQYKFNTNASTPKIREYANTFDLSVDLKALVLALAVKRESNIYLGTSDPERLRDRIYSAENRGKAEDVQNAFAGWTVVNGATVKDGNLILEDCAVERNLDPIRWRFRLHLDVKKVGSGCTIVFL